MGQHHTRMTVAKVSISTLTLVLLAIAARLVFTADVDAVVARVTQPAAAQTTSATTTQQTETPANTTPVLAFSAPTLTTSAQELVFEHTTRPHTDKAAITRDGSITYDSHGRIARIDYRLVPHNGIALIAQTTIAQQTTLSFHGLVAGTPKISLMPNVWTNIVEPWAHALKDYPNQSNQDVNVIWTLTYSDDYATQPDYIELEAYTPNADTMNSRLTIANRAA